MFGQLANATSNRNGTETSFSGFLTEVTAPLLIVLGLVCFLVNAIILMFFVDPLHSLRRPSGYFVASLSFGSLCTGISAVILTIPGVGGKDLLSVPFCFVILSASATSSYCFVFILSFERIFLVSAPLKYKRVATVPRARVLVICVWTLSLALGVLIYSTFMSHAYIYFVVIPFGAGFLAMVAIDVKTFIEIRKSGSRIENMTEGSETVRQALQKRLEMEKKFARVVVLLLLNFVFFACPMLLSDVLAGLNISCHACMFPHTLGVKLVAVSLFLFIFHDINGAMFYIILIPKYRLSLIAILKLLKTKIDV